MGGSVKSVGNVGHMAAKSAGGGVVSLLREKRAVFGTQRISYSNRVNVLGFFLKPQRMKQKGPISPHNTLHVALSGITKVVGWGRLVHYEDLFWRRGSPIILGSS